MFLFDSVCVVFACMELLLFLYFLIHYAVLTATAAIVIIEIEIVCFVFYIFNYAVITATATAVIVAIGIVFINFKSLLYVYDFDYNYIFGVY